MQDEINLKLKKTLAKFEAIKSVKQFWLLSSIQSYQLTLMLFFSGLDLRSQVFNWVGKIAALNLFFDVEVIKDGSGFSSIFGFGTNTDNTMVINPLNQCLVPTLLVIAFYITIALSQKNQRVKATFTNLKDRVFNAYVMPNLLISLTCLRLPFKSGFRINFMTASSLLLSLVILVIYVLESFVWKRQNTQLLRYSYDKASMVDINSLENEN